MLHKASRVRGEPIAIDFHFALRADEHRTAHRSILSLETDGRAVGILHGDDAVLAVRPELRGTGAVFTERPLNLVDAVRRPSWSFRRPSNPTTPSSRIAASY